MNGSLSRAGRPPRFRIVDQPSQVHYPEDAQDGTPVTERAALLNLYETIQQTIDALQNNFQVTSPSAVQSRHGAQQRRRAYASRMDHRRRARRSGPEIRLRARLLLLQNWLGGRAGRRCHVNNGPTLILRRRLGTPSGSSALRRRSRHLQALGIRELYRRDSHGVRGSFFFGGFCAWSAVPDHCHEGVGAPSGSRPCGQIAWKILARKNVISEPVAAISR